MALTAHGIPPADGLGDPGTSVLLIFLAESRTNQDRILAHVRPWLNGVQIQPWRPSNHLLHSIAAQGKHRDSMANIYCLAIVAYRAGWKSFLVADELTNRQISGKLRCGESPDVSLAMVSVALDLDSDGESDVRVIAKRTTSPTNQVDLYQLLRTFDVSEAFVGDDQYCQADIYQQFGLQLHNPDRSVFSPDTTGLLTREVFIRTLEKIITTEKGLPAELTTEIVSHIDDGPKNITLPPFLSHGYGAEDGTINWCMFLLRPTSEIEREALQSAIEHALNTSETAINGRRYCIHLVPWSIGYAASRRDLPYLFNSFRLRDGIGDVLWVLELPCPGEAGPVRIMKVKEDPLHFPVVTMSPLEVIIPSLFGARSLEQPDQSYEVSSAADHSTPYTIMSSLNQGKMEILYSQSKPFCRYPPSPVFSIDPRLGSIPLFCLTASFTAEDRRLIQEEVLAEAGGDDLDETKHCFFVHWNNDTHDGGPGAMWQMFWELTRLKGNFREECDPPYFFVDRQSLVDNTVIAVYTYEYIRPDGDSTGDDMLANVEDSRIRGILYGRIEGRETHVAKKHLGSRDMLISEFLDDPSHVKKYLRPDWPGHGILHDEWTDDEDEQLEAA